MLQPFSKLHLIINSTSKYTIMTMKRKNYFWVFCKCIQNGQPRNHIYESIRNLYHEVQNWSISTDCLSDVSIAEIKSKCRKFSWLDFMCQSSCVPLWGEEKFPEGQPSLQQQTNRACMVWKLLLNKKQMAALFFSSTLQSQITLLWLFKIYL